MEFSTGLGLHKQKYMPIYNHKQKLTQNEVNQE